MIRERWQTLSQREKVLVGGGAVLLGIILLWMVVIGPIRAAKREGLAAYDDARETYAAVQRAVARGGDRPAPAGSNAPLRTVLAQTADGAGIVIDRYDIQEDAVNLTVGDTDMATLYRWLVGLSENHGIDVVEGSIRPVGEEGGVTARLTVERAG